MREIKFRGKRKDTGEWVYGYYLQRWTGTHYKHYIHDGLNEYEVNPETVGQFTELPDKNGVEIYEGDIVENCLYIRPVEVKISEFIVEGYNEPDTVCYGVNIEGSPIDPGDCKVIGNIHDSPELAGGARCVNS